MGHQTFAFVLARGVLVDLVCQLQTRSCCVFRGTLTDTVSVGQSWFALDKGRSSPPIHVEPHFDKVLRVTSAVRSQFLQGIMQN